MDGGFVALAFGFCAAIVNIHGDDVIDLGETVAGQCETHVWLGDTGGEAVTINGHDFIVDMTDEGASVTIDARHKKFIPKTIGL